MKFRVQGGAVVDLSKSDMLKNYLRAQEPYHGGAVECTTARLDALTEMVAELFTEEQLAEKLACWTAYYTRVPE